MSGSVVPYVELHIRALKGPSSIRIHRLAAGEVPLPETGRSSLKTACPLQTFAPLRYQWQATDYSSRSLQLLTRKCLGKLNQDPDDMHPKFET